MKTIIKIVLIVVIIGVIIYAVSGFILEPMVQNKVQKSLNKGSGTDYNLTVEHLDVRLLGGSILAQNIRIEPKTSISNLKSAAFDARINELEIEGIDLLEYLFTNRLDVNEVEIDTFMVNIYSVPSKTGGKNKGSGQDKQGSGKLKIINISSINIDKGLVTQYHLGETGANPFVSALVNIDIDSLSFDPELQTEKQLNYAALTADINGLELKTADSLRQITANNISMSKGSLQVNNMRLSTRYGKYEIAEQVGHEIDWMQINVPLIDVNNIDFKGMILGSGFNVAQVSINHPEIEVFRDKRQPDPENPKKKKLISGMLKGIKSPFSVDSIILNSGHITYLEHVEEMEEPGELHFDDVNISFENFTNDSTAGAAKMQASALVMGKGMLTVNWDIPLDGKSSTTVEGTLDEIQLTEFNPMITPVAYTVIKSGVNNSLNFNFQYDLEASNGEMVFRYENLQIEALSKQTGGTTGLSWLKTFVANMVVQNSNTGADPRTGEINFERDEHKSVLNYWWKSLLTGIKNSIGVPTKGA